jgi:hypothetical protein
MTTPLDNFYKFRDAAFETESLTKDELARFIENSFPEGEQLIPWKKSSKGLFTREMKPVSFYGLSGIVTYSQRGTKPISETIFDIQKPLKESYDRLQSREIDTKRIDRLLQRLPPTREHGTKITNRKVYACILGPETERSPLHISLAYVIFESMPGENKLELSDEGSDFFLSRSRFYFR